MREIMALVIILLAGVTAAYAGDCGKPAIHPYLHSDRTWRTAKRGSWPWQVLVEINDRPNCGGTLIAPRWVVTSAQCVYNMPVHELRQLSVVLGEHNRNEIEGSEQKIMVRSISRHHNYNPRSFENDIAMLKLTKPARLGVYVKKACLPSGDVPVGTKCYVTGWRNPYRSESMAKYLEQGVLTVESGEKCYADNICGKSAETSLSGCLGDSGDPYVCEVKGVWELHGSLSYGSSNCRSTTSYTVFTRIYNFKDWIEQTMRRSW